MRNAKRMAKRIVGESTLALPPEAAILEDEVNVDPEADVDVMQDGEGVEPGQGGCACPECGAELRLESVQGDEQGMTDALAEVSESMAPTGEPLASEPEPV